MPVQYITLKALSVELGAALNGSTVKSIFTQRKNELLIGLEAAPEFVFTLSISVEPRDNFIFFRNGISRAKKNSVDLLAGALGAVIEEIFLHPLDRSVCVRIGGSRMIVAQLYNTAASNVYLVDENGTVLDAFKEGKKHSGARLNLPAPAAGNESLRDKAAVSGKSAVHDFLKDHYPLLGRLLLEEVLNRSSIDREIKVRDMDERDIDRLSGAVEEIFRECGRPSPSVYETSDGERFLSAVGLSHLEGEKKIPFPSVNEAVKYYLSRSRGESGLEEARQSYLRKLKPLLRRDEKALQKMAERSGEEEGSFKKTGDILLANLHKLKKGMNRAELEDIYGDGAVLKIDLDPSMSPAQNAERYFEKEKRAALKRIEEERRMKELALRGKTVGSLIAALETVGSEEDLRSFRERYQTELKSMDISTDDKEKEERPPFRIFSVAGDFEVWVGKSSANNDLLTTRYCKPQDLWFHVRGAGGSHTVLKVPKGTKEVPRESIKQTAKIAAYYSKMRNASNVPVAYCERKYVRKPKGVKEGTVYLEREEVVFVSPGLP